MHSEINRREYPRRTSQRTLVALIALATLTIDASQAFAQMQIPNPLIRPRSLATGNADPTGTTETGPAQQRPASPPNFPAPAYTAPLPNGLSAAQADDPYARDLIDLRDRLSAFYVSAIVGKKAILRRSASAQRTGGAQLGVQATGTSMAPLPLASGAVTPSARNDSITVTDGELLDAVSNNGTLMTKISNGRVVIFHVQELGTLSGGRLGGRRAIVFAGDVENSGTPALPAIVLERPDPSYRRSISVDTKVRSASGATPDTNAAATQAATPPLQ